jgi:hypothetical protein
MIAAASDDHAAAAVAISFEEMEISSIGENPQVLMGTLSRAA